jgi:hypothetical protein
MAWRGFRFGVQHIFRDAGYSAMSIKSGEAVASGDYLMSCLDERRETMTFAATDTDHVVACDTGATPPSCDRIVVPVGHNFNTHRIKVQDSPNSDYSGSTDRIWIDQADALLIDKDLDTTSTGRYKRVLFHHNPPTAWNPVIPELWLTTTLDPDAGPDFKWREYRVNNSLSLIAPSGERGDIQLGASQRVFELEYPYVEAAADIAILNQLVDDVGMDQAFLLDPPFSDDDVVICKMLRDPERAFAHSAPNSGSGQKAYSYRFWIIEQIV